MHQTNSVQQRIVLRRGSQRAVEVVQRRQQLAGELGHAALLRLRRLARDALAEVLEVGLRALREREVLITLRGQRDQLVEVALEHLTGVAAAHGLILLLLGTVNRRAGVAASVLGVNRCALVPARPLGVTGPRRWCAGGIGLPGHGLAGETLLDRLLGLAHVALGLRLVYDLGVDHVLLVLGR